MKKKLLFLIVVSFIFLESCNTDFSINEPGYEDIYILNCILQNDSSIQYAVLTKNIYTESGTTPTSNSKDQYVKGANIKILYNNSVFVMKDTTLIINIRGNITEANCYYIKDLVVDPGKAASIEATAPNGKILKSTIQVPKIVFRNSIQFSIPPGYRDGYRFIEEDYWSWVVNNIASSEIINLPQLEVYYMKYEKGKFVDKKIVMPLGSDMYGSDTEPNRFVNAVPSYIYLGIEAFDIINTKMQEISGNDPNKRNYIIEKATFSVLCIDPLLSRYYTQYNTYLNDFSIKLYPTDYSNIEGGKGIFGIYYRNSTPVDIDSMYVHSFGYQYKPR